MASLPDVMQALFTHALTIPTGSPPLPICLPEPVETFDPPESGQYLDVQFFSNRPAWEGLTAADGRLDQGLLQITVVWPKNHGLIGPGLIAELIKEHFPLNLTLWRGSAKVRVTEQPWTAAPMIEPSEVRIPVTIPWSA